MHELSLAGNILQLIDDAAARQPFGRVHLLRLQAGALAGVEVQALRFALEAVAPGTRLEGATIEIDEPPGQAWCRSCARTVVIGSRIDACPSCGSHQLQPTGGTELKLVDLVVAD